MRNILMIEINKLHSCTYVSRKFVLFYYYIFKYTYRQHIFLFCKIS